jgi:hypothetical protein
VYYEAPRSEYEAFLAAKSKGRYLTFVFLPYTNTAIQVRTGARREADKGCNRAV